MRPQRGGLEHDADVAPLRRLGPMPSATSRPPIRRSTRPRRQEARDRREQRGLARAGRPEERQHLAGSRRPGPAHQGRASSRSRARSRGTRRPGRRPGRGRRRVRSASGTARARQPGEQHGERGGDRRVAQLLDVQDDDGEGRRLRAVEQARHRQLVEREDEDHEPGRDQRRPEERRRHRPEGVPRPAPLARAARGQLGGQALERPATCRCPSAQNFATYATRMISNVSRSGPPNASRIATASAEPGTANPTRHDGPERRAPGRASRLRQQPPAGRHDRRRADARGRGCSPARRGTARRAPAWKFASVQFAGTGARPAARVSAGQDERDERARRTKSASIRPSPASPTAPGSRRPPRSPIPSSADPAVPPSAPPAGPPAAHRPPRRRPARARRASRRGHRPRRTPRGSRQRANPGRGAS